MRNNLRAGRAETTTRYRSVVRRTKKNPQTPGKQRVNYKSLFEDAPLAYHCLEPDGSIAEVNRAWLASLGYERDEVVGKELGNFLYRSSKLSFKAHFDRLKRTCRPGVVEYGVIRKDGSVMDVLAHCSAATRKSGGFRQSRCIMVELYDGGMPVPEAGRRGVRRLCPCCKSVASGQGRWMKMEDYLREGARAKFSYYICPDCSGRLHLKSMPKLTERERAVLGWVSRGKTTWETARLLGISQSTVKYHMGRIMRKLDAVSRAHAVAIAIELGIIRKN